MLEQLNRIVVVTGHYGSGKTNLSVNLAMSLRAAGEEVTLVDLDIVNPYFRSADFETLAEENGIRLIAPVYARSNLDIPALDGRLDAELDGGRRIESTSAATTRARPRLDATARTSRRAADAICCMLSTLTAI